MAKGPFKLRSGNSPLFKQVGATPAKDYRTPREGNQAVLHNRDYPSKEHTERHKRRDKKKKPTPPVKDMKTGSYAHKFEEDSKDTPAYLNNFGIGKGTSPIDKKLTYEEALKNDPDLEKHIAERKKYKPGSDEYEAAQAKINTAYGTVRDQDLKAAQIKKAEKATKKEEPESTTKESTTKEGETTVEEKKKGGGLGGILIGALTGGLDAVYGTGKILPSSSARLIKKKVDDDAKPSGEHIVDNLISNPASTSNMDPNRLKKKGK